MGHKSIAFTFDLFVVAEDLFGVGNPNLDCLAGAQNPADTAIAEGATNAGARNLGRDGIDS
jgi:hypothetical protein